MKRKQWLGVILMAAPFIILIGLSWVFVPASRGAVVVLLCTVVGICLLMYGTYLFVFGGDD